MCQCMWEGTIESLRAEPRLTALPTAVTDGMQCVMSATVASNGYCAKRTALRAAQCAAGTAYRTTNILLPVLPYCIHSQCCLDAAAIIQLSRLPPTSSFESLASPDHWRGEHLYARVPHTSAACASPNKPAPRRPILRTPPRHHTPPHRSHSRLRRRLSEAPHGLACVCIGAQARSVVGAHMHKYFWSEGTVSKTEGTAA